MTSHTFPHPKDPSEVLDYSFDWSDATEGPVLQESETISTSTVTVSSGLTKDSDSETDGVVTVFVSGGEAGESYTITSTIVTNAGRTYERSALLKVQNR